MEENILKVISNVSFWPKGVSTRNYYNIIFTDNRIVLEFINKNVYMPRIGLFWLSKFIKRRRDIKKQFENDNAIIKDIEKILDKDSNNFIIDYCGITTVIIKNGVFELKLERDYPLIGKECTFHFPKETQYDVESIFMKMLPNITLTK